MLILIQQIYLKSFLPDFLDIQLCLPRRTTGTESTEDLALETDSFIVELARVFSTEVVSMRSQNMSKLSCKSLQMTSCPGLPV